MDAFTVCPSNEHEWKILDRRVVTGGIYDFASKINLASTFGVRHYLGLKVVWKCESGSRFLQTEWLEQLGTDLPGIGLIRQGMYSDPAWNIYLKNLDGDLRRRRMITPLRSDLGAFAIVLQNQRLVSGLGQGHDHELKVTGVRGQVSASAHNDPGGRRSSSSTSVAAGSSLSISGWRPSDPLFDSPLMRKLQDAATACEEVVKMAALSFLQGLFVNNLTRAYWSAQPKRFTFGQSKLEAAVDGHLHLGGTMKSAALLNVSARRRSSQDQKYFRTEWLESAQMALWIKQEPDCYWTAGPNEKICRRILVSQNHSDMFVILGEYERSYLEYLRNQIPMKDAGFLTMHRFGPFSTDKANDMDLLGCVLRMLIPLALSFPAQNSSPSSSPTTITAARPIPGAPTTLNRSSDSARAASESSPVSVERNGFGSGAYSPDRHLSVLRTPYHGLEWTGEHGSPSNSQASPSPPSRSLQNLGLPELFSIMESNRSGTSKPRAENGSGSDSPRSQQSSPTPSTTSSGSDEGQGRSIPILPLATVGSQSQLVGQDSRQTSQTEHDLQTSGFSEGTEMDQAWAALEFGEAEPEQPIKTEIQQAGRLETAREEVTQKQKQSPKKLSLLTRGGLVSPRRAKESGKSGNRSSSPLRTTKSAPAATVPRASDSQSPRKIRSKAASK